MHSWVRSLVFAVSIFASTCSFSAANDSAHDIFQTVCLDTSLQFELIEAILDGDPDWKEESLPPTAEELAGDLLGGVRTWRSSVDTELATIGFGTVQFMPDLAVAMCSLSKPLDGLTRSDFEAQMKSMIDQGVNLDTRPNPLSSSSVLALGDNLIFVTNDILFDTMIQLTAMDLPDELLEKMAGTTE